MALNSDPFLIHVHIPKTAGSTFNSILHSNFKDKFAHENPYLSTTKYSMEEIKSMFFLYPFSCYAGHVFSINKVPFFDYPKAKAISFVRDPVKKFISYYFYQRSRGYTANNHPAKKYNISEYIDWQKNETNPNILYTDNSQLDWVLGKKDAAIEELKSFINPNNYFVFPSEKFEDSLIVIEKLLPEFNLDCSFPKSINASVKDQEISDEIINKIESLDYIKKDKELHELITSNFNTYIQSNFTEDQFIAAKKDFTLRCFNKSQSVVSKKPSFSEKLVHKIKTIIRP